MTAPDFRDDTFIGSIALLSALHDTYVEHIGIVEHEGPDGPYMWCACGWRSDDLSTDNPGAHYAVHLSNALHAAVVKALQPIVRRIRLDPSGVRGENVPDFREALEAACLEGLIDTEHGYSYRPSVGADAVLALLAERLGGDALLEAVARALCKSVHPGGYGWTAHRDEWIRDADAALAAVRDELGVQG